MAKPKRSKRVVSVKGYKRARPGGTYKKVTVRKYERSVRE